MSQYLGSDVPACVDHLPTISGGLALPPKQRPPVEPPIVVFAPPPDELTTIFASIRNAVTDVVDRIRRAAASHGIS